MPFIVRGSFCGGNRFHFIDIRTCRNVRHKEKRHAIHDCYSVPPRDLHIFGALLGEIIIQATYEGVSGNVK